MTANKHKASQRHEAAGPRSQDSVRKSDSERSVSEDREDDWYTGPLKSPPYHRPAHLERTTWDLSPAQKGVSSEQVETPEVPEEVDWTAYVAYSCKVCADRCINRTDSEAYENSQCWHCLSVPSLDEAAADQDGPIAVEVEDETADSPDVLTDGGQAYGLDTGERLLALEHMSAGRSADWWEAHGIEPPEWVASTATDGEQPPQRCERVPTPDVPAEVDWTEYTDYHCVRCGWPCIEPEDSEAAERVLCWCCVAEEELPDHVGITEAYCGGSDDEQVREAVREAEREVSR